MNEKYNWKKLEVEFRTHNPELSPTAFAREKCIPKQTLLPICRKNDWVGKRDRDMEIVETELSNNLTSYQVDKRTEQSEKMSSIIDIWLEQFDGEDKIEAIQKMKVKEIKLIGEMRQDLAGGFKKGKVNFNFSKNLDEMSDAELLEVQEVSGVRNE